MKDIADLVTMLREHADTWQNEAENGGRSNGSERCLAAGADVIERLVAALREIADLPEVELDHAPAIARNALDLPFTPPHEYYRRHQP